MDPSPQAARVRDGSVALVAFGGNAILREGQHGTLAEQEQNARAMCSRMIPLLARGYELVVTHGNGPQVGNLLMQNELAREWVPTLPLDVLVAQTEGSLGYLIQQALLNELERHGLRKGVATLITQVLVDRGDPAFSRPTKPVGPFYRAEHLAELRKRFPEWRLAEDAGRGYRRIVPSPAPRSILQASLIRSLVYSGNVVLALGGGGVPMIRDSAGRCSGVEAVIDKDLSSAMLAVEIKADLLVILTGTEHVCFDYGRPGERKLGTVTAAEVERGLREGQFPEGSMGPKMTAALEYLREGGRAVLITDPEHLDAALDGKTGTRIVRA